MPKAITATRQLGHGRSLLSSLSGILPEPAPAVKRKFSLFSIFGFSLYSPAKSEYNCSGYHLCSRKEPLSGKMLPTALKE